MPISVKRDGNLYTGEVTPPHGGGRRWTTDHAVTGRELVELLKERGCHQTDIGDAFYEADRDWLSHLDG
jgi:hypothetical protein